MKSHVLAFAALAAIAFSGAAFGGEATKPTPMTDEQMDAVTAGSTPDQPGLGLKTAQDANGFFAHGGAPNEPNGKGNGTATQPGPAEPSGPPAH